MPGYFRMLVVYRTKTLEGQPFKFIVDPVTVEGFTGSRKYQVPVQDTRVNVIGQGGKFCEVRTLELPEGERYISLTSRSKTLTPDLGVPYLEDAIDKVIAHLSIVVQPHLFFEQVYRGPVWVGPKGWISSHIRPGEKVLITPDTLCEKLLSMNAKLVSGLASEQRYRLMARFYSRSLAYDPSEEKFLLLWTILEIHPMSGTSNIRNLVKVLADITGKQDVKERLQLGRLTSMRGDLVHDGKFPLKDKHLVFIKLELIVHAVMRHMCGLPYDGALDRYW